jgi:2-iminobutanoate/2-iminopropanoate deaminase
MKSRRFIPPPRPVPGMSAAVVANGVAYVAGQVAFGPDGSLVGEGDCAVQARQCFANVEQILVEVGCGMSDIVSLTTYLSNAEDSEVFVDVRGEVFPVEPPATTTVVAVLLSSTFLIEIQAIAVVPE